MSYEAAVRATEILLALALLQQYSEHVIGWRAGSLLLLPRAGLSVLLMLGVHSPLVLEGLCLHSLAVLYRYQGPYNGGSDRMGLLVMYCLCLTHWLPERLPAQAAFGYLAVQVVLSYFISGQVKITNPDWRSGQALRDVFAFSAYPVAKALRQLADRPRLLWLASWAVILLEVLFPLSFLNASALAVALALAALFHLANACLFGLNRFVWVWIAAYPSLLWLHARLMAP